MSVSFGSAQRFSSEPLSRLTLLINTEKRFIPTDSFRNYLYERAVHEDPVNSQILLLHKCSWVRVSLCVRALMNVNPDLIDFRWYNWHELVHVYIWNIPSSFNSLFLLHLQHLEDALITERLLKTHPHTNPRTKKHHRGHFVTLIWLK